MNDSFTGFYDPNLPDEIVQIRGELDLNHSDIINEFIIYRNHYGKQSLHHYFSLLVKTLIIEYNCRVNCGYSVDRAHFFFYKRSIDITVHEAGLTKKFKRGLVDGRRNLFDSVIDSVIDMCDALHGSEKEINPSLFARHVDILFYAFDQVWFLDYNECIKSEHASYKVAFFIGLFLLGVASLMVFLI